MSPSERLTTRQQEVYSFIRDLICNRGYGPTVREIGENFAISSPNGVMCHLRALEKKGLIVRRANKSRAIELTGDRAAGVRAAATGGLGATPAGHSPHEGGLPLVGVVAAGSTTLAFEQCERVDFRDIFSRDDLFVLRVSGDSMIEAQIADGDYVILRKQTFARPGQIVAAQTDDGEATLKYWYPEKGRIRLQPANASMDPIYVADAQVLGVVVGLVRDRF